MKIIEALKELPLLEKRINKQCEQIMEYAALGSHEESPFGTREAHRKQLESLVQSNKDLASRYEKLKLALTLTNASVKVDILGTTKTIAEWITFKSSTYRYLAKTLTSLDLVKASQRVREVKVDITEGIRVERMYDEQDRNRQLNNLSELFDKVDGTLEVVNATTDLVVEI